MGKNKGFSIRRKHTQDENKMKVFLELELEIIYCRKMKFGVGFGEFTVEFRGLRGKIKVPELRENGVNFGKIKVEMKL